MNLAQLAASHGYVLRKVKGPMPFEIYRPGSNLLTMNFRTADLMRRWLASQ